jgi:phospholipase D-like protein/IPT/TIG domain-containing protein
MFRITNAQITDATIAAFNRGLPIRMIVDSSEYRNPARVWDSYNVDRLFMAGIPLKITEHQGQNHEKSLILYGQGMSIWGSSNWTWPSFNYQQEHNYFTLKPWFLQWFQNQFERRWNSDTEYKAFVPMGPGSPSIKSPVNGATGQPTSMTLVWEGGPWGQQYDVYFGTTSNPPLLAQNVVTGAPENPSGPLTYETYKVSGLAPATLYYWKIVSKTMASLSATGPVWTFTTGTPATGPGATVTAVSPTTGPSSGATNVTVTGTNFLTGAIVSFGQSTAGSIKVISGTTITAVAPPHVAGTVGITVTNKAGDTGTLPAAYLYTSTSPSTAPKLNVIQPNTGSPSGGESVTISGSNLVQGMTVTIGGSPATITSSNSVSIRATTPSGTGVADLVVTNPNGQSASLRGAFTYAEPPGPPNVTSTVPGSGSVNGGNTITVKGSSFSKGAVVSVGGTLCTTIIVSNSSTITATTPAHSLGSADVVVKNIDGQSSTLSSGFTYVAAPPPSISNIVPNSGSVAGGSAITINGSNFVFGATVLVGSAAATVQTTTGSYIYATVPAASQPGTVNVIVTNPDGQSSPPGATYTYQ